MEFARGSQSLQLPELGAFLAFVQPELSAWKEHVGMSKHLALFKASEEPRFYSFLKPECLTPS